MNILNEEVRIIREQIAFTRRQIRQEGLSMEKRLVLLEKANLLEKELNDRLEKLQ